MSHCRSWCVAVWLAFTGYCGAALAAEDAHPAATAFQVQLPASAAKTPQQGRLMLLFSNDFSDEPRNQVDHTIQSQAARKMLQDSKRFFPVDSVA